MNRVRICRVCAAPVRPIFSATVLGRSVEYQECDACGYVQTETPTWLAQAYDSAIGTSDTGILRRNRRSARVVVRMLAMLGRLHGQVIDCAGGYGLLVRMLRDLGVDARWQDPYCANLVARGFEAGTDEKADLVTAFEVMEHMVDPVTELQRLCERAPHVLVSTSLIPAPTPPIDAWWYYAPAGGQHIGFFRRRTLERVAATLGRRVFSDGRSFHLFTADATVSALRFAWARKTIALAPLIARTRLNSRTWDDFHAAERGAGAAPQQPSHRASGEPGRLLDSAAADPPAPIGKKA